MKAESNMVRKHEGGKTEDIKLFYKSLWICVKFNASLKISDSLHFKLC